MAVMAPGQVAEGLQISSTSWMSSHPHCNPHLILPPTHTNHHQPEQQPEATAEASLLRKCPSSIPY